MTNDSLRANSSRPVPELTEAMLEAGATVVSEMGIDLADGRVSPSEVAEAVFMAMAGFQKVCALWKGGAEIQTPPGEGRVSPEYGAGAGKGGGSKDAASVELMR